MRNPAEKRDATLSLGYRFVFLQTVALTPSAGFATVIERGPISPAPMRGAGIVGVTAGVTF